MVFGILGFILGLVSLVMVNNNQQQQSITTTTTNSMTTAPAPPIGQQGTASIFYIKRNIYTETLDLSQQTKRKIRRIFFALFQ